MQRILIALRGGGEEKKRADVERADCGRVISHISSHSSVASHILAMPGVVVASRCLQQLEEPKCKGSTTHGKLYRNARSRYVTQIGRNALQSISPSPRPKHK
jgi:hypothetical protein